MNVEEIKEKYQVDAPRVRSVEEKQKRVSELMRSDKTSVEQFKRLRNYRNALNNSAQGQAEKKTYKVKVVFTSKVDATTKEQAIAIAKSQVNHGTKTAWNSIEKATIE